ncbi:hypothetical protein EDI_112850 [Entamoeba dispar SAW760]|uniref:TLDc domain-containing protein n=1 Tax=Entamoeba dispar (strain ATCC PRA-260 / SAW760) TaxID=370354 RepID=B0E5V2_ENTDS|nr:uncharacterized protein EDI_112850 [Entamoeba dispar SAW760]EDR30070.1 hypothetical protein EDI_112850 [Entamoeba dispar SAW760]|eukprot:EDR30070.1 hypothetical protein EDI_112850 [Entamoeba dispar SAW760]
MTTAREQLTQLQNTISKLPKDNQNVYQKILVLLSDFNSRLEKLEGCKSLESSSEREEKSAPRISITASTNFISYSTSEIPEINSDLSLLRQWTGKQTFRLLFDSSRDGLLPAAFNTTTSLITNMMVIVISSDNYIFGTFNSYSVPPPPVSSDTAYIEKDPNYFVFSLKNPHGIVPTRFSRKRLSTTLRICPSDGDVVVGASDCFSIIPNNSYIIPTFGSYYIDTTGKGADIFVGNHYPSRFSVKKVYAIQWV